MSQKNKILRKRINRTVGCGYLLFLPKTYPQTKKKWPLILFLHGSGERGEDLSLVKKHGVARLVERTPDFPFIVVSPQCPPEQWWSMETLGLILDEIERKYRVDRQRIYLTGLSMGGYGTWQLAIENPNRFAAIAPICGGGNPHLAYRIKHLPIWVFHGAKDEAVPVRLAREMVAALRRQGSAVRLTVYPELGHDSWTKTYENEQLYDWFLSHRGKPSTKRASDSG